MNPLPASNTSLYTCVSSDFRGRALRGVLDETIAQGLSFGEEETS
jgi:integrase/recombinase XerD